MAKYTIELRHLAKNLFDFDYPYYDETVKCYFEEKFIEHYYFNEIGFETIARFKQQLRAYLLRVMPLYKQRYEIELRCKDIDFMLNKDLKETFIREIEGSEESNYFMGSNENSSNNVTSNLIENGSNKSLNKESNIEDGVSSSMISEGYLTGSSQNDNNFNNNSNSNSTTSNSTNSTTRNNGDRNNSQTEKTELLSQGNIGVTSSAELKEKWVKVLVNLDEEIILGARNLFMMVY